MVYTRVMDKITAITKRIKTATTRGGKFVMGKIGQIKRTLTTYVEEKKKK